MKEVKEISTEEKIIVSALDDFCGHGYAGARVYSIAMNAGVNTAAMFYHFKSKEESYESLLTHIFQQIVSMLFSRYSLKDIIANRAHSDEYNENF